MKVLLFVIRFNSVRSSKVTLFLLFSLVLLSCKKEKDKPETIVSITKTGSVSTPNTIIFTSDSTTNTKLQSGKNDFYAGSDNFSNPTSMGEIVNAHYQCYWLKYPSTVEEGFYLEFHNNLIPYSDFQSNSALAYDSSFQVGNRYYEYSFPEKRMVKITQIGSDGVTWQSNFGLQDSTSNFIITESYFTNVNSLLVRTIKGNFNCLLYNNLGESKKITDGGFWFNIII